MTQGNMAKEWFDFFLSAGIPEEVAENYTVIFKKNDISLDMLPEINKEYLCDMGIHLIGHIIAILRHAKTVQVKKEARATLPKYSAPSVESAPTGKLKLNLNEKSSQNSAPIEGAKRTVLKRKETELMPPTEVKKTKRLPPVEESSLKIKMPSGSTDRSRQVLARLSEKEEKKPVFERLGLDTRVSSTTEPPDKKEGNVKLRLGAKVQPSSNRIVLNPTKENPSSTEDGIFSRLGNKVEINVTSTQDGSKKKKPALTSSKKVPAQLNRGNCTMNADTEEVRSSLQNRLTFTVVNNRFGGNQRGASNIKDRLGTGNNRASRRMTSSPSKSAIKSRLQMPQSTVKMSSSPNGRDGGISKKVSFGTVTEKTLPKSLGLATPHSKRLKGSIGFSTGIYRNF